MATTTSGWNIPSRVVVRGVCYSEEAGFNVVVVRKFLPQGMVYSLVCTVQCYSMKEKEAVHNKIQSRKDSTVCAYDVF